MGFAGKLCVHCRQASLANTAFLPSAGEIEHSRQLLAAYESALEKGRGPIDFGGQMIDEPLAAQTRRVIDLAAARRPLSPPSGD
jgi:citrate lyase subunit beta/citryl-CoA lyase